jgi:ATP-dependent Clp protease ATP-binding subunit ClpA
MQSFHDNVARCTDRVRESLKRADQFAGDRICSATYPIHVLRAIALEQPCVASAVLDRLGVPIQSYLPALNALADSTPQNDHEADTSAGSIAETLISEAKLASDTFGHNYIGTEHLLLGILTSPTNLAAQFLASQGATVAAVRHSIHCLFGLPNADG